MSYLTVSASRAWHWVTENIIDLHKGAAVGTALAATLLALFAFQDGPPHAADTWFGLLGAVVLLPLVWRTWRRLAEQGRLTGRAALPPFDQQESADPQSNVRRID